MPSQQLPASVRKAVCALYVATALAAVSVAVIVGVEATDNNLAEHLREAYPQRAADEIEMAESSILTYLFTLAALGACLFVAMAWGSRRGRRWVRGAGGAAVLLGTALAAYNFSQPHPLAMTVAGLVPCAAGLTAVALLWTRESSSYFGSARTTSAAARGADAH
ncbi:hypothetical protein [Streptomyces sp. 7-21]|uniref:hypothetical protein n=1 Tax=Streptomyces sp. 7-21 TaxID=2802283 RepID=UPI00191E83B4|nr:hypothetical protein [Streptomyces sp. 7-21]MBL1068049.1 hypothetical protein [Streptomyces sp. 7-21]